jgi:lactoylglutathione lyase
VTGWPSSTSATSSSPCRSGARSPHDGRHLGLVVDDRAAVRAALDAAGVPVLPGRGLSFRDPWGNRVEVVQYDEVQFTKGADVLRGMGIDDPGKTPAVRAELQAKGLA